MDRVKKCKCAVMASISGRVSPKATPNMSGNKKIFLVINLVPSRVLSKVSCFLTDTVHWTLIQVDPLIDKDHLEILNLKIPFRLACVEKSVSNIFRGPV